MQPVYFSFSIRKPGHSPLAYARRHNSPAYVCPVVHRIHSAGFLNHNMTSLPFALIFHFNAIFNCICCMNSFSPSHKCQTVDIPEASPFSKDVFLRNDLIQHKRGKLHFYILYNSRVISSTEPSLHIPNIQMFVLRQAGDSQG